MKSFTFRRFTPPNTHGPEVVVARKNIVAIEQHYDPKFDPGKGTRFAWRSLLHLRGGSTLLLSNDWEEVVKTVYGDG